MLIVDAWEGSRNILELVLGREGFEVMTASSTHEAMALLSPHRPLPDAVVAEVDLRGEDGFSLTSQLRAEQRTADLPVFLLSRKGGQHHRELAIACGADDFLLRPLFARDVLALVKLATAERGLDGKLELDTAELPLALLLRALLAGIRSGRVDVSESRHVVFRDGKVVDARFGSESGVDALLKLLLLAEGPYAVRLGPQPVGSMRYGVRELVTQAFPKLLRFDALVARSVPLGARFVVDFAQLARQLEQLPDAVSQILRLFDGVRTVREVLADSTLGEVLSLQVATRLYAMGLLVPAMPRGDGEMVFRPVPRLFEPVPQQALLDMAELFGDQLPHFEELPATEGDDWAKDVRERTDEETWRALSLSELDPAMARQLHAFNVQPVVEVRPAPTTELGRFAAGAPGVADASIGSALDEALRRPIPLTQVVEPALADAAEQAFFDAGDAPARSKSFVRAAAFLAGAVLLAAVGVVAWRIGSGQGEKEKQWPPAPNAAADERWPLTAEAPLAPAPVEPMPTGPKMDEANRLYDAGHYREAAALLEEVLTEHPRSVRAWVLLGQVRFDGGDRRGAESAVRKALALDPKDGQAIMLLATVYLVSGQKEKAALELRRYLEVSPDGEYADEARRLLE